MRNFIISVLFVCFSSMQAMYQGSPQIAHPDGSVGSSCKQASGPFAVTGATLISNQEELAGRQNETKNDDDAVRLFSAIEQGQAALVARLSERVDLTEVYVVDGQKKAPLHTALIEGRQIIATLLLAKGAPVHTMLPGHGTPLHIAMKLMLAEYSDKRDACNKFGGSFCIESFVPQALELFSLLLHHGASIKAQDEMGQTIFHELCKMQHRPDGVILYKRLVPAIVAAHAEGDSATVREQQKHVVIEGIRKALACTDAQAQTPLRMLCDMQDACLHKNCDARMLLNPLDEAASSGRREPITLEMICADDSDSDDK